MKSNRHWVDLEFVESRAERDVLTRSLIANKLIDILDKSDALRRILFLNRDELVVIKEDLVNMDSDFLLCLYLAQEYIIHQIVGTGDRVCDKEVVDSLKFQQIIDGNDALRYNEFLLEIKGGDREFTDALSLEKRHEMLWRELVARLGIVEFVYGMFNKQKSEAHKNFIEKYGALIETVRKRLNIGQIEMRKLLQEFTSQIYSLSDKTLVYLIVANSERLSICTGDDYLSKAIRDIENILGCKDSEYELNNFII